MMRVIDCEYIGVNSEGKHIVTEQLYPESRGWVEHEFESEEDAMEWLKNLRERVT